MENLKEVIVEGKEFCNDVSYDWILKNSDLNSLEKGIPILNFSEAVKKKNIEMEFRVIRRITETQYHNDNLKEYTPDINAQNRYKNIIPYKHSEVKLEEVTNLQEADSYINANYINTIFAKDSFIIATQGPLKKTFRNFWKMVYQKNVKLTMKMCKLKEDGKSQCDQYWPEKEEPCMYLPTEEEKEFKVSTISENVLFNSLYEREIELEKLSSGDKRIIKQYQLVSWDDHSIPSEESYEIIIFLLNLMIDHYTELPLNKVVIHCSAGVGRTGTLTSLFNLVSIVKKYTPDILKIKKNGDVDEESSKKYCISIFSIVRRLREQRWGMVHTSEQYVYLYNFMRKFLEKQLILTE